ncbi:MAG TPA: DinB family protein [Chryseosolibacter sp.]
MKRCLLALIFLVTLFSQGVAQSADKLFLAAAVKKLRDSKEYTLKVARLMPAADYGFQPPVPEEMSFAGQLLHLSQNTGWLTSSYLKGEANPVSKSEMRLTQKDSVIAVLTRVYDYALDALERFPADDLKSEVSFFAGPMNKLQIINLLNDHQTHHRAQLLVYLRLKGIKPPDYVGW